METGSENIQTFTACFLYPGVARYDKDQTLKNVLIDRHIEDIAKSFIGSAMIINHSNPAEVKEGDPRIVGKVTNVFLNKDGFTTKEGIFVEADQKYYCDFYLKDETAIKEWQKLGFVSCAWEAIELIRPERNERGQLEKLSYINVEYEAEVKSVKALHMAIVADPRYEQSIIYKNSMSEKESSSSIELEKGIFLNYVSSAADKARELFGVFANSKKSKKNDESYDDDEEAETEKENAKSKMKNGKKAKKNESDKEDEDSDKKENSMDVDGELVPHEELKNCYRNAMKAKKNEKDDADEKDEKSTKENSHIKANSDSGFALKEARDAVRTVEKIIYTPCNGKNLFK